MCMTRSWHLELIKIPVAALACFAPQSLLSRGVLSCSPSLVSDFYILCLTHKYLAEAPDFEMRRIVKVAPFLIFMWEEARFISHTFGHFFCQIHYVLVQLRLLVQWMDDEHSMQ